MASLSSGKRRGREREEIILLQGFLATCQRRGRWMNTEEVMSMGSDRVAAEPLFLRLDPLQMCLKGRISYW